MVIAETAGGAQVLRQLIDQLRRKAAPIAVLLAAKQEEGKVMLAAGLSRDLVERGLDAVAWVRGAGELVGGSGGGRPDMAQAGGKNADKLGEALEPRPGGHREAATQINVGFLGALVGIASLDPPYFPPSGAYDSGV